ncbi:PH domain-containing protein [Methanobrevibacter sp.]|uniref:PH domain-containing protein n=1 Tax=Methanobrevibacter sp. TaxID=66852 RepID=UPI003866074D
MILGCKKAILGVIILIIILNISPIAIKFIGEMQVYMISQVKLSLTRYMAIAFFVIILINVIYIIWQLIGWYSMEYTLTESRIIIKSGVISTKKNYMPYATIQDINSSQNILSRLLNVGSVSVYSAYDNNQLELKNISNPSKVEEIIFSRMVGPRNFQAPPQSMPQYQERGYNAYSDRSNDFARHDDYYDASDEYVREDYLGRNDFYDEYEPITPITHERNARQRGEYEYYPEDFESITNQPPRHTYEYEPYDSGYSKPSNNPQRNINYNPRRDDYSYDNDDYYYNNEPKSYYDEVVEEYPQNDVEDMDIPSDNVIRRHFDKFKK